jgi:hypothetical protein
MGDRATFSSFILNPTPSLYHLHQERKTRNWEGQWDIESSSIMHMETGSVIYIVVGKEIEVLLE